MSNVAVINSEIRPQLVAGHKPQAIVPNDMESAYRLAKAICVAGMAPKEFNTPEKCMVAILHGMEIGLTPMIALQRIAVVNGRPTLWGDGAMSLVRGSGLCEWVRETIEGAGDNRIAVCEAKRRGEQEPIRRTFSVEDAKRSSLWGKSGPWQQYPERMLQMRARAFALRDGFADVMGGMYLKEELEDVSEIQAPPQTSAKKTPPRPKIEALVEPATETASEIEPTESAKSEAFNFDVVMDSFEKACLVAKTEEELQQVWDEIVEPHFDKMLPHEQDEFLAIHRTQIMEVE